MKLSRTVKHTIRMGQYESVVLEASVETEDFDTEDFAGAAEFMQLFLDGSLAQDLKLAEAGLDGDSYLPTWNENKRDKDQ